MNEHWGLNCSLVLFIWVWRISPLQNFEHLLFKHGDIPKQRNIHFLEANFSQAAKEITVCLYYLLSLLDEIPNFFFLEVNIIIVRGKLSCSCTPNSQKLLYIHFRPFLFINILSFWDMPMALITRVSETLEIFIVFVHLTHLWSRKIFPLYRWGTESQAA